MTEQKITRERAERIAKAHPCAKCSEYSYKRVSVKPASERLAESLGVVWSTEQTCGVCGAHHELGIDAEGQIVYES
jgi:transcription elongation factor Elf1